MGRKNKKINGGSLINPGIGDDIQSYGACGTSSSNGEGDCEVVEEQRPLIGEEDDQSKEEVVDSGVGSSIDGTITRYSRRWDILCLLSIMGLLQNTVWNSWGPIACTASLMYDWGPHTIAQLANHGPTMYLAMIVPALVLRRKSLRTGLLVASGAITLGTFIRASSLPSPSTDPFIFTITSHLCSLLNGMAATLLGSGTLSLVFTWFPGQELRTALTISQIFFSLGPGISFLMAAQMVEPLEIVHANHNSTDKEMALSNDMQWYLYSQAIPSAIFFIFIVVYFPSGSSRQDRRGMREQKEYMIREMKVLMSSRKAWLICLGSAIPQGVVRSWLAVSVISLVQVCKNGSCLTQSWVNDLAIIACLASVLAGMAAVRMVVVTTKHLQLTVVLLFLGAFSTFFCLALVSYHILPSSSLVNTQISILFLFVTGYSLIISSVPLTLKIATDILSPSSQSLICYWLTIWTNVISLVFLAIISIPDMPTRWLIIALPVSSLTGLLLLLPLLFI